MRAKHGFFDLETYGGFGVKERKTDSEAIEPLCCAIRYGQGIDTEYVYLHLNDYGNAEQFGNAILLALWQHSEFVETFWAHNMGRFDGLFLCAAAMRMGWLFEPTIAGESRIIALQFQPSKHARKLIVNDTFALVPASLREIAEDFELPSRKLFDKEDYKGDMRALPSEKLRAGCFADCQIGLELLAKLEAFVAQANGRLRRTFSSTALGILKAAVQANGDSLPSHFDYPTANPIARKGYYGGRVEVFNHTPDFLLKEYDINSSYPYAMTTGLPWHPIGMISGHADCDRALDTNPGIFEATVSVRKDTQIPLLPWKHPKGGLFFPTGKWRAWFPGNLLLHGQCGNGGVKIERLHSALIYTEAKPFAEHIRNLYGRRKLAKARGQKALSNFLKLTMNGSYGKFGEHPEHAKIRAFETSFEALDFMHKNDGCQLIDPCLCERFDKSFPCPKCHNSERIVAYESFRWAAHAHFGIASYVTGEAQINLHNAMMDTEDLCYVDTDGVKGRSYRGSNVGDDLGQLKLEKDGWGRLFFAPKIYWGKCGDKEEFVCKGFPTDKASFMEMLESAEDIVANVPEEKRRRLTVERTRLFKSQIKSKNPAEVLRIVQSKSWKGLSMKRRPLPDGKTVPWTVDELLDGEHRNAVSPAIRRVILTHEYPDTVRKMSHNYKKKSVFDLAPTPRREKVFGSVKLPAKALEAQNPLGVIPDVTGQMSTQLKQDVCNAINLMRMDGTDAAFQDTDHSEFCYMFCLNRDGKERVLLWKIYTREYVDSRGYIHREGEYEVPPYEADPKDIITAAEGGIGRVRGITD